MKSIGLAEVITAMLEFALKYCRINSIILPLRFDFKKPNLNFQEMGGTALKRKARRNKARAKSRLAKIKLQGFKPVIRNIDIDAIKAEFKAAKPKSAANVEEPNDKEVIEAVKTEIKEVAPNKDVKAKTFEKKEESMKGFSEEKKKAKKVKKNAPAKAEKEENPPAEKKQSEKK